MNFVGSVRPFLTGSEPDPTGRAGGPVPRMRDLIEQVKRETWLMTDDEDVGHESDGECQVRLAIRRAAFLKPLKQIAAEDDHRRLAVVLKDLRQTTYAHLLKLTDRAVLVPRYFFFPALIRVRHLREPISLISAVALSDELTRVDRHLLTARQAEKLPDRIDVGELHLGELGFTGSRAWVDFAFSALHKLVKASIDHHLPVLINLEDLLCE